MRLSPSQATRWFISHIVRLFELQCPLVDKWLVSKMDYALVCRKVKLSDSLSVKQSYCLSASLTITQLQ